MNIENPPNVEDEGELNTSKAIISSFEKDAPGIHPHSDILMIIIVRCDKSEIKRVLVDQGSYANILYWEAFETLHLDLEDLKHFKGFLVGFSREHVQVKGYITMKTTFGEQDQAREIKVRYFIIDAPSSYNMIIGNPSFNHLGDTLSTLYLCMNYTLSDERIRVTQGD